MKKVVFELETLTCPSCIKKIENVLGKEKGVSTVKVLFHSSKVRVQFDSDAVTAEQLREILNRLGYPVLKAKVA